jgi:uncharacterized protein YbaR (Trm112 family)
VETRVIDKDLLAILACPDTRQPLALAGGEVIERINSAIRAGTQKNVGGALVDTALEAGLVREDGARVYPIRDGIPVLLSEEGLPVSS